MSYLTASQEQLDVPICPVERAAAGPLPNHRVLELAVGLVPQLYSVARWLARDQQTAIDLVDQAVIDVASKTPRDDSPSATDLRLRFLSSMVAIARALEVKDAGGDLAPILDLTGDRQLSASVLDQLERLTEVQVRNALGGIPLSVRMPVVLYYLAPVTFGEIAEMLGLSTSELARRLGIGRDLLVAQLADPPSGLEPGIAT